eukprot:4339208-Lingulodinium_polyedra.AAC.1
MGVGWLVVLLLGASTPRRDSSWGHGPRSGRARDAARRASTTASCAGCACSRDLLLTQARRGN